MLLDLSWFALGFTVLASALFFSSAIRIFREYERGVVFTLGRFWKVKGPGLVIIIPVIQKAVRVDPVSYTHLGSNGSSCRPC